MKKSATPLIKHISDFLDYLEIERGLSENTQENYSRYLKKFTDWLKTDGHLTLLPHQVTSEVVWRYRLYLARGKGFRLTKQTQNYYLIALRSLLNYFAERDITSLPSSKIQLARDKKNASQVKFLQLEQIAKLLSAPDISTISGLRDRAILEVLFSTGLRVAELASLNRDKISSNLDGKSLELVITGKGKRVRTIYFSERCLKWLKKYLASRRDDDLALFIHYKSRTNSETKRLSVRSIERIVKKYNLMVGISVNTTPHTLRHSYATDLLNQGVDLRMVQEFLGHSNIATTQIYTHVTSKKLKEIHSRFHSGHRLKDS